MSVGFDALSALLTALADSVAQASSAAATGETRLTSAGHSGVNETGRPCTTAEAYLGTTLYRLEASVELEIAGNRGGTTISFVSGTALSSVIAAIGTVVSDTGVSATQAVHDSTRIELRSVNAGSDQFVSVRQLAPLGAPIIFATEHDEHGLYGHMDYGEDAPPGDVDCDLRVGMSDLVAALRAWGVCGACPEDVNGDGVVDGRDIVLVLERWDT